MRSKFLAIAVAAVGLGLGTSAGALSAHSQGHSDEGHNVELHGSSGRGFGLLSFYQFSGSGWGDHRDIIESVVSALRKGRGLHRGQVYGTDRPGRAVPNTSPDAGYVPEPGAVGVFSVGLLVAGALIRGRARKS